MTFELENEVDKILFKNRKINIDWMGNLCLRLLLASINDYGFPLKSHFVYYYSQVELAFVFIGKYPLLETTAIPLSEISPNLPLRIKLKIAGESTPQLLRNSLDILDKQSPEDTFYVEK